MLCNAIEKLDVLNGLENINLGSSNSIKIPARKTDQTSNRRCDWWWNDG